MYDDSCFKYQKIFSGVNSPLKGNKIAPNKFKMVEISRMRNF